MLLCLMLLAGCAAFAEEEAPIAEVEVTLGEEPADAGEQAVAAVPMDAEAPAEPAAVAAPAEPKGAAGFAFSAKASAKLNVGEQLSLIPDTDGVLFLSWSSSKPGVASVDENGLVTANAKGKAKITAKTNAKKTYKLALTVVDPYEPTGISIAEGKSGSTTIVQSLQLNAVLEPSTAKSDLVWSSSKPKVATVDANGLVAPLSKGKTKITVKCAKNKKKAVYVLTVTNPYEPAKISIAEGASGSTTIAAGLQLTPVLEPATAMSVMTWKSSKPKVATEDGNGFVTPLAEGKTKITVTTDNKKKAVYTLTVTNPYKPGGISFAQGNTATAHVGWNLQLTAVLEPLTAMSTITWKSSNPKVATVDANGLVKGVSVGTAKITATTENKKKAVITITVEEAPATPVSQVGPGGMIWLKGN